MNNIIFVAPPAAGKGTISDYLVNEYHYHHLSTGELFRSEIINHTALGEKISGIMAKGDLVDDTIINNLVYNVINNVEQPFILDGYPRNIEQAKYLINIFDELKINNYFILNLDISEEALIKRMESRKTCPKCNRVYNLLDKDLAPKNSNLCDLCNLELVTRDDDNIESFKNRYRIYDTESSAILKYFNDLDKVKKINTDTSLDQVLNDVKQVLSEAK